MDATEEDDDHDQIVFGVSPTLFEPRSYPSSSAFSSDTKLVNASECVISHETFGTVYTKRKDKDFQVNYYDIVFCFFFTYIWHIQGIWD